MFCSSGFLLFSLPLYTDKQINKSLHVRQISCTVSYATYHRIREDFLHYISSLECVPFKMLPREILSTKVLRDLIPHIWTLPVLQKSMCDTNTWCKVGGLLYEKSPFLRGRCQKKEIFFHLSQEFHLSASPHHKVWDQDFWHMLNMHFTKN